MAKSRLLESHFLLSTEIRVGGNTSAPVPSAAEGKGAGEDGDSLPPSMQVHHVQAAELGSLGRFPREEANTHGRSNGRSHCKTQRFFSCQDTTQFPHSRCSHSVTRSFTGVWRELQLCLTDLGQSYQSSAQPGRNGVRSYPSFLPHYSTRTPGGKTEEKQGDANSNSTVNP